ncbi:HupU protein [Zavarzinia sp.]|uniref:NADH-quinone oxidoreductase subunit B family protein n=1 Tax=Zavarzinia sp. TaxID=2027920 RepID=UPI00356AD6FD
MTRRLSVLWLQSGGCGGCTMSLLCAEAPDFFATLEGAGIDLLWHPTLSEETGAEALDLLDAIVAGTRPLDVLCLEGSVLRGPNGTGRFHMLAGTGRATAEWLRLLAARAHHVVAVGSCAAFGGITAGGANPADACGLQYDGRQKGGLLGADFTAEGGLPVINIAGCPTHPNWVTETLMLLAAEALAHGDLDHLQRPRFYADHLVHHGCTRNEYYEYKASAEKPSDLGCMMEHMGCLGTQAHADCNTRLWNGEGSCTRGGYACINCTAPEFEEPGHPFAETPKFAGIPIGLPTDMPKAWFVALSSLAKAATPERVRRNAATDHIAVPPTIHQPRRR